MDFKDKLMNFSLKSKQVREDKELNRTEYGAILDLKKSILEFQKIKWNINVDLGPVMTKVS